MRIPLVASLAFGVFCLASCAVFEDRIPTSGELVGVYDMGDGGFAETVELFADGSFTETLHPHLGTGSATFGGYWQAHGKQLTFRYAAGRTPRGGPLLTSAEAFVYRGMPAFARVQDLKDERVHEWWVFKRRVAE